ncbi:MAG TPA: hypothetical protein VHM88_02395 [Candidatus Acidoferrales bacterium]|jgi:hypothetical protein|nr:hypothetical protein [Candidatus Acidoferrales bacterium]
MRITNWGMFLLGIYLILNGLTFFDVLRDLGRLTPLIGIISGVLILMEYWRR